jgi:hypothetical protein
VERLLIPVAQVEMVEIIKESHEITVSESEIRDVESVLVNLQEIGDSEDGKQTTTTAPQANSRERRDREAARKSSTAGDSAASTTKKRKVKKRRNGRQ